MPREHATSTAETTGDPFVTPGLGDLIMILWRERGFMIAVFLVIFLVLAMAAMTLKSTYTARAGLLARLDEAYAYNPLLSQTNTDISLGIEQIIQSEIRILEADVLKRRTIEELGLATVYPDLAMDYLNAAPGAARERILSKAVLVAEKNLGVAAAPGAANFDARFTHEDPDVAAQFLNTLIANYLDYRPSVLLGSNAQGFETRRDEYEARLSAANNQLERFLAANGIGEFESYRDSLQTRQSEVSTSLMAARADLEQTQAKLGALRAGMARLPAEAEQYVDDASSGRLQELLLERADLLSRYTEESVPVREVDERIAEMRAFIGSGAGAREGARRVGPNPVLQQMEGTELDLASEASALSRRVGELSRQSDELQAEQLRVQALVPEYEKLIRDISSLQDTVGRIASRVEENRAQRELAADTLDNVTVVQPASVPLQGESAKKLALVGAFMFAGFVAVLAGLARGLLRGAYFGLGQPKPAVANARLKERTRRAAGKRAKSKEPDWAPPPWPATAAGDAAPQTAPSRAQLPVLAVIERHAKSGPAYG